MVLARAVCYALLAVPLSAHANMLSVFISPANGSTEETGATAKVSMSFDRVGNDDRLTLKLENTTPATLGSKLTAFGFELPDNWKVGFAPGGTGSYFDRLDKNVKISPSWLDAPGGFDLMLTSDGNFEGGSAQGAPSAGEFETVVLSLGSTGLSTAQIESSFSDFYSDFDGRYAIARFQAVGPNGRSDRVGGEVPKNPPVPEPVSLLLLAVGGVLMRRPRPGR